MNFLFEFFPLLLFLGTLLTKGTYPAVVVLMIAMPLGLFLKYLKTKTLDKMYFWSTVMALAAGGLTLYFRDVAFLTWKPTVFYWAVAAVFLGSQLTSDKPMVQRLFGLIDGLSMDNLSASQWRTLNSVWVAFFVFAGILNIVVAKSVDFETWAKFKVFGLMGITFVFMLGQTLWLSKFITDDDAETKEGSQ